MVAMNKRQSRKSKATVNFAESRKYENYETDKGGTEVMTWELVYDSSSTKRYDKNYSESKNKNKTDKPQYIHFANKITNNNRGDIHGNLTVHMDWENCE